MKRSLNLFFVCVVFIVNGQNQIPNGSFENGRCPYSYSMKPSDFDVNDWHAPDKSTPDYYHRCAKEDVSIPFNWAGGQNPVDGDAYVGIYLKKGSQYQENIGTLFTKPLEKNSVYEGSFYVANAANAEFMACEISVLISKEPIHINLTGDFEYRQIKLEIPPQEDLADFKWRKISFQYIATGGEKYFYVGSLTSPVEHCLKNIRRLNNEPMLKNSIYVFLDDIQFSAKNQQKKPEREPTYKYLKTLSPIKIYFEFDQWYLTDGSAMALDTLADFIETKNLHLLITGATDSLGTSEYNFDLGQKRAIAVKDYLIFLGVDQAHIKAISKGEDTPNYSNHSEDYRQLNRNVLIEFFIKEE